MPRITAGSQTREELHESGYICACKFPTGDVLLIDVEANQAEIWTANDDFAGYVIVIDGVGHEFITNQ